MNIDVSIAEWMTAHRSASIDQASQILMWLGTSLLGMSLCAVALVVVCLVVRRAEVIVATLAAVVAAGALSLVLKSLTARPRPGPQFALVAATGYSLPSTAAALCTAGLVVLLLLVPRRDPVWGLAVAGLVVVDVLVGFALVYLGAHWFTDVVAGAALGGVIGVATFMLTNRIHTNRSAVA